MADPIIERRKQIEPPTVDQRLAWLELQVALLHQLVKELTDKRNLAAQPR